MTFKSILIIPIVILSISPLQAQKKEASLKTFEDTLSYCIGVDVGNNFKTQEIQINPEVFLLAMKHALGGATPVLSDSQMQVFMAGFQEQLKTNAEEKMKQEGETNKINGARFLDSNKTNPDVVTLASGLQYKIINPGTGPNPARTDKVTVHYRGRTIDGKEFDSSHKRGQPATFPLTNVIAGWTEALQLMPVGSVWELYLPAELAYGERGAGGAIGPNEVLIFEVELISIAGAE